MSKAIILLSCVLALSLSAADPRVNDGFGVHENGNFSHRVLRLEGPVGRRFRARQAAGKGITNAPKNVKKALVQAGHQATVAFEKVQGKAKNVIDASRSAVKDFGQCVKKSAKKLPAKLKNLPKCVPAEILNAMDIGCRPLYNLATDGGTFQGASAGVSCDLPDFKYTKSHEFYKTADASITADMNAALGFAGKFKANLGFQLKQVFDARFTLPALTMSTGVSLTLKASKKVDPCAANMAACTWVVNQGLEELFATLIMAGPVPIAVRVKATAYVKAIPKIEGNLALTASVTLKPITLTSEMNLNIQDAEQTFRSLQQLIKPRAIMQQFKDNLEVRLQGSAKASASLQVCAGVKLTVIVNGMTSTVDVPVCVTAKVEASASIDLVINPLNPSATGGLRGSGNVAAAASVTRDAVEMNIALGLVDASSALQGYCGVSNLVVQTFNQHPVGAALGCFGVTDFVKCGTEFQSDMCAAAAEVLPSALKSGVSFLSKTIELVPAVTLFEKKISASFSIPAPAPAFMGITSTAPERLAIDAVGETTPAPMYTDRLESGQELFQGQELKSPNGIYRFIMQLDGNAVLYKGPKNVAAGALWAAHSNRFGAAPYRFAVQCDRNLVVYGVPEALDQNGATWESNTWDKSKACTSGKDLPYLQMQNDGNLVFYGSSKADGSRGRVIWASKTNGK